MPKDNGVPGVGHYSPEKTTSQFRNTSVKMRSSSQRLLNRPSTYLNHVGPGAYDAGKQFGKDVKSFKIK